MITQHTSKTNRVTDLKVSSANCINCGAPLHENFCSRCGQSVNTHRIALIHFAHEIVHALTHSDKSIFTLMWSLAVRPGKVIREYLSGKRKKYFNPAAFLLILVALQIFVTKKSHFYEGVTEQFSQYLSKVVVTDADQQRDINESLVKIQAEMLLVNDNSKVLSLIMIPFVGLLTWLFFYKSGYNYAENMVLHTFILGQTYVLFFVLCWVPSLVFPSAIIPLFIFSTIVGIGYSIVVYVKFFERKWLSGTAKDIVIQLLYALVFTQVSTLIIRFV